MRIAKKWIALAALVCFLFGAAGLLWLVDSGVGINAESVDLEKKTDAAAIDRIVITSDMPNVTVVPADGGDIRVRLYGKKSFANHWNPAIDLDVSDQTATFRVQTMKHFQIGIDVPNMLSLIKADEGAKVEIALPDKRFHSVEIKANLGNLHVQSANAKELQLSTKTGSIKVDHYKADRLTIRSGNGSVAVPLAAGELSVDTDTGSIKIGADEIQANVTLHSDTGSIGVLVGAANQLGVDLRSSTGHTTASLPGLRFDTSEKHRLLGSVGTGKPIVKADTSTGNITIEQK